MEKTGLSAPAVAKQAGVDRKTLNNQLNGRFDPRPEQVQLVAEVFGYNNWELLNPAFDPDKNSSQKLRELVELYAKATDEGKENILRVAEMAAKYSKD